VFSHSPYLKSEDIAALRKNDLYIPITPESEFHYSHGQQTGHLISDKASLGVDTSWTFSGDILGQARLWLQSVRNRNFEEPIKEGKIPRETPMKVEQAFLLATRQGGRALRRKDVGVLQVGAKADIVVFNGDSPNMLGWSVPVAAVMLHANVGDIEHVLVSGEFRKRDFKLAGTKMPWTEIRREFLEAAKSIQHRVSTSPPVPEKFGGVADFGSVSIASTASPT
jgi:cytosine/adenosine deaminase-related metal-dependent hydrolase